MENEILTLDEEPRKGFRPTVSFAGWLIMSMLLLLIANVCTAYSAETDTFADLVGNVHFVISDLKVVVTYDLYGEPGTEYDVSLVLRKRDDPSFRYSPKELSGDVGLGKYAGTNREIVWNMGNDFPQGFVGNDFYFVVNAKKVSVKHSSGILTWIGAGAVAVAAAVTYVIVTNNGGPTSPASYPTPPGRP